MTKNQTTGPDEGIDGTEGTTHHQPSPQQHKSPKSHNRKHEEHHRVASISNEECDEPNSMMVAVSAFKPSPPPPSPKQQQQHGHHEPPKPSSWRRLGVASMQTLASSQRDSQQPLTVFAKLTIQPGYERDFERWFHDMNKLQHDHWPGYLSSELLRPIANSNEYINVFRYDNYEHLEAWMTSTQRHTMLQRAKEFSQAPPQLSFHSLEFWFVPPQDLEDDEEPSVDGQPSTPGQPSQTAPAHHHVRPPARYKMIFVTFLVIWSLNQFTGKVLLRIFGKGTLPTVVLQAMTLFLTVVLAAYVTLPITTALLGFWLFPHQPYTTSLRNGVMSLPWPIPRLLTRIESSPSTTKEASKAAVTAANSEVQDDDDQDNGSPLEWNSRESKRKVSFTTVQTDLEHGGHDDDDDSHSIPFLDGAADLV